MPTIVENILDSKPAELERIVRLLKDFFANSPERLAALRLAVLGVIDLKNDDPRWDGATKDFNRLFSGKLPTFQPLTEEHGKCGKIIKRFAFRKQDSDRPDLGALLSMYVIHQIELRPNLRDDRPILKEAFSIDNTLNRVWNFLRRGGDHVELSPVPPGYGMGGLLTTLHAVLGTANNTAIDSRLFGGSSGPTPRVSNYVMYRYSTGWGGVVKSFLTILNPEISGFGSYYFVHVYGPGDDASRRISYGAVVGFESSIYFLGGGRLASDMPMAPLNRGFKAFAVPYAAFNTDHRRLTGVMLSNSRSWYPVIARFAMIHIGFTTHTQEITHRDIGIRFIEKQDELRTDIPALCEKFKIDDAPRNLAMCWKSSITIRRLT